ncbi:MAG: hypothetical protein IJ428_05585 [Clostridia bacterium]|nr:hypothetical protein [Clostridia bacterium]
MAKSIKKLEKKAEKKLRKGSKKLSKQLYGKKSLTLKHTYDSTVSIFGSVKEKHPLFTITASGEYKISVFKLIVIAMCIISTAALIVLLVKSISDYCREKRERELWDEDYEEYFGDGDELPF